MKRDIRKAVEEIKSAGMEDFLHQDPSTFECDDDKFTHHHCTTGCKCTTGGKCPRTRCTRVKHCTFVTKCTHVKMDICYEMYTCTCSKWTFVTKVTRRKECVLVTKRTRRNIVHSLQNAYALKRNFSGQNEVSVKMRILP